jgi:hypothetical protein
LILSPPSSGARLEQTSHHSSQSRISPNWLCGGGQGRFAPARAEARGEPVAMLRNVPPGPQRALDSFRFVKEPCSRNKKSCHFDVTSDEQEHTAGLAQDGPSGYANTHSFRHHLRSGGDRSFHTISAAKTRLAERAPTTRLPEGQLRAKVEDGVQVHQNGTADRRESTGVSAYLDHFSENMWCGSCEWGKSSSGALTLLSRNSESCGCREVTFGLYSDFLRSDADQVRKVMSIDPDAFNTPGLSDLRRL